MNHVVVMDSNHSSFENTLLIIFIWKIILHFWKRFCEKK